MAEYTEKFLKNIQEEKARKAASTYLARVHGSELAQGQFDIQQFEAMDSNQRLAFMVQMRRGTNVDIFAGTVAAVAAFGAGAVLQNWFPYSWQKVPILPTVVGVSAFALGMTMKRSYAFRNAIALSGVTFALGGGTLGRMS